MAELKQLLINSATTDAVFRYCAQGNQEKQDILHTYNEEQAHDTLINLIGHTMKTSKGKLSVMELTSFSNILTEVDRRKIQSSLGIGENSVKLLSLHQYKTQHEYLREIENFTDHCLEAPDQRTQVLLVQCPQAHKHGQLLACARYSLMNVLKKLKPKDDLAQRSTTIAALLLCTERQSGPASKTNEEIIIQHTKESGIIYVDELRPANANFAVVRKLCGKTLSQVIQIGANEIRQGEAKMNFLGLLQDCICEAVTKITTHDKNQRNLLHILRALCSDNDKTSFMNWLLEKMIDIYKQRDEEVKQFEKPGSWIKREACSVERLQEGGTFGKTLCLSLKRHLSRLLAYIVSVLDENNNLDFLIDTDEENKWKVDMWMEWMCTFKLNWKDMKGLEEFSVKCQPHLVHNFSASLPFSFSILTMLEDQWSLMKGKSHERCEAFLNLFRTSHGEEYKILLKATKEEKGERAVLQAFAHDVVMFSSKFSGMKVEEIESLTKILLTISQQKKQDLIENGKFHESDAITLVFYSFKVYIRYFEVLHSVCQIWPGMVSEVGEWMNEQKKTNDFIIHELAMENLLEWVNERALHITDDADTCMEWMNLTSNVKRILYLFQDLIIGNKEEIKKKWDPLSLLDLFLLQLLPSTGQDETFNKYVEVIVAQAKRLLKAFPNFGIRSKIFLRIISNVLRKCYEDIQLKTLVSWGDEKCQMCRRVIRTLVKLPCDDHFMCEDCLIKLLSSDDTRKQCPSCPTAIPQDYPCTLAELTVEQEEDLEKFKSNCTSFFLQYIQLFCFPPISKTLAQEYDMKSQANLFLHQLVAGIEQDPDSTSGIETLALDLNTATRSNILQILMEYDPAFIQQEADEMIPSLGTMLLEEFIVIALNCYETIIERNENKTSSDKRMEDILKETWEDLSAKGTPLRMEVLQLVAKIRYSLTKFVTLIQSEKQDANGRTDLDAFCLVANEICTRKDKSQKFGQFVVKTGCQLFGTDWLKYISSHDRYKDLNPTPPENSTVDYCLLLGEEYRAAREELNTSTFENFKVKIQKWIPADLSSVMSYLSKILAVSMFSKQYFEQMRANLPQEKEEVRGIMKIISLFQNEVTENDQNQTLYKLIILVGCIVMFQPKLMKEFHLLLTNPQAASQFFWPAMPQMVFFSIRNVLNAMHVVTYYCPNGHPYTIGDCGRPTTKGKCPVCHEQIGGLKYVSAAGNQQAKISDKSETGYQLNTETKNKDDPAERMTKQGAAVVQFLLHSCMLIGLKTVPHDILSIMNKNTSQKLENDVTARLYLMNQLQTNVNDLSEALGRNFDDAVVTLHEVLVNIMESYTQNDANIPDWATIENRQKWEKKFRQDYLLPVFQDMDNVLRKAQLKISTVENLENMKLYRMIHDISLDEATKPDSWMHPALWKTIRHPNAAHLMQTIGDSRVPEGVIQTILKTRDLHLLQHLESALKLQQLLIKKYQNQIDMKHTEDITFETFFKHGYKHKQLVEDYIKLWNRTYHMFLNQMDIKICDYRNPISTDSPISTALPSLRGRGRCAKMLSEYLIEIHNSFLERCHAIMKTPSRNRNTVDVAQLLHSNFIKIDKQRDLVMMIHMHTTYNIVKDEKGCCHHEISYNTDALEKMARENYVTYVPFIEKGSLPCITYPQDIGIGSDWDKVASKMEQKPLSPKIAQEIDDTVARQNVTSADVCEGVRILTYAISFLAKVKAIHSQSLHEYMEKHLSISPDHMTTIPKSAQIQHTLAVYQRLSWHKAVIFVRQGLEPYKESLHGVDQEEIQDNEILTRLHEAFEHMDMEVFQQRLNEMLIKVPDYKPEYSLKEHIFPNLEFIGNNTNDSWYNRIPEEICFKHIAHVFKLSVKGIQLPDDLDLADYEVISN